MNGAPETVLSASSRPALDACAGQSSGWIWAGVSRIGRRHASAGGVCEDALGAIGRNGRLHLALADGVSRGARGDVAAAALVRHGLAYQGIELGGVADWMDTGAEPAVRRALANYTTAPGAATFAGAWLTPAGKGWVTRVGDCRAYAWQPPAERETTQLTQLLPDQTMAYMGYVPPRHPRAANPAHMVGNGSMGQLEWWAVDLAPGGGLLLCSDGLHGALPEPALARSLHDFLAAQGAARRDEFAFDISLWVHFCNDLIDEAQVLGSDDDVSVLLALRI